MEQTKLYNISPQPVASHCCCVRGHMRPISNGGEGRTTCCRNNYLYVQFIFLFLKVTRRYGLLGEKNFYLLPRALTLLLIFYVEPSNLKKYNKKINVSQSQHHSSRKHEEP